MYFHSFSFRLRCVDCRAHWCECVGSVIWWPGLRMSGDAQGEEWDWEQLWQMFHQSRNLEKKRQFATEENTLTHSLSGVYWGEARRTSTITCEASKIADRRVFWTHCKQNNNPERLTIKAHNWHQTEPGPRYTVLSSTRTFTLHYFRKALFFSLWNSGNNEDLNSCVSRWAEYVMCVSVLSSLLQETFSRRF